MKIRIRDIEVGHITNSARTITESEWLAIAEDVTSSHAAPCRECGATVWPTRSGAFINNNGNPHNCQKGLTWQ